MLASTLQSQSPYTNTTILGSAIGAQVIESRLELGNGRIPCRILFELDIGDRLEHIFQASSIKLLDASKPITAADLQADPTLIRSSLISKLTISTRENPQSTWKIRPILVGQYQMLQLILRGLHKRVDRETNSPYLDANGREILHAQYCFIKD